MKTLAQKKVGVEVVLFKENGHGKRGFLTTAVVNDFIQEYPTLRIKPNADCHDRLIVLDYEVTRTDIKILKQIQSLGDEQYKRLMAYMKALQKLEEMESIVEE